MKKVAVFLAEGFEEIEALTPVDLCRRADIDTIMVSVTENKKVTGTHGISIMADMLLVEVDFDSLDMLILPGGMPGTTNLENSTLLMQKLDAFYEAEKYISAICAAPSILGHRGYLKNRNACAFPGFEEDLVGANVSMNQVEVSGPIITSRGMGAAIDFGLAILEKLCGSEKAEEMAKAILYL